MGGSAPAPSTTTQIQKTELPAWVDAASQENYQFAQMVANRPFQNYQGTRVAGQNALETAAPGMVTAGAGMANAAYGSALDKFNNVPTIASPEAAADVPLWAGARDVAMPDFVKDISAKSFLDRNIGDYMNPFTQGVIDTTRASSLRDESTTLQKNSDAQRAAGAWGGSRDAITNAVIQSEGVRNRAAQEANLRSAAFTDAAGRVMADNALEFQGSVANQNKDITGNAQRIDVGKANQGADIAKGQLNANIGIANQNSFLTTQSQRLDAQKANASNAIAAAAGLAGLGDSVTNSAGKNALLMSQLGQTERSVVQANLDSEREKWDEGWNYPTQALNMRLAALGMSPYGKTTTSTGTSQGGTSSNGLMTGIGAVASFLPLMFSDRKVKKDVKRLGKVPGTDLNAYEFRYKKSLLGEHAGVEPKQVGLMAQDVERKVPEAVQKVRVGGKTVKAVDYPLALAGAPRDPRDDKGKKRGPYKPRSFLAAA